MRETEVRGRPLALKGVAFYLSWGLVFLILETTVLRWLDPARYGPDLTLILVVYLGLRAPLSTGALLVVSLGFLADVAGGGPVGLHPGVFLAVLGLAGLIRQSLDPAAPGYLILVIFVLAALAGGLTWAVLFFLNRPVEAIPLSPGGGLAPFAASAALTALAGPFLLWFLERFRPETAARPEESG